MSAKRILITGAAGFVSHLTKPFTPHELVSVVARATGVSVWEFLAAPIAIALAVGLVSSLAIHPFASRMKDRAERIQAELNELNLLEVNNGFIGAKAKSVLSVTINRINATAGMIDLRADQAGAERFKSVTRRVGRQLSELSREEMWRR